MRALLWKETRENLRWLPVGLIVIAALCLYVHPMKPANIDYSPLAKTLAIYLGIVMPLLAFALGLLQSYRDLQPDARAYLHHREVKPTQVAIAKLLVGFGLYAVAVLVPITLLAGWIAYQGIDWYPMRPAQVIPAMVLSLGAFLWHPAAMLMMARKASWWGTKWFPLAPAAVVYFVFIQVLPTGGLYGAGLGAAVAMTFMMWLVLIVGIEWKRQPNDPPAAPFSQPLRSRFLLPGLLIVSSICVVCGVLVACVTVLETARPTRSVSVSTGYETFEYAIEKTTGTPMFLQVKHEYDQAGGPNRISMRGDSIEHNKKLELRDLPGPLNPFIATRWMGEIRSSYSDRSTDGFFGSFGRPAIRNHDYLWVYDSRGQVLVYDSEPHFHLTFTLTPNGIQNDPTSSATRFTHDPLLAGQALGGVANDAQITPLLDGNGLYAFRAHPKEFAPLLKRKIKGAIVAPLQVGEPAKVLLRDDRSITVYQFTNLKVQGDEAENSTSVPYLVINEPDGKIEESFKLDEVTTFPLPEELRNVQGFHTAYSRQNRLYLFAVPFAGTTTDNKLFIISEDGKYEVVTFKNHIQGPVVGPSKTEELFVATWLPVGLFISFSFFGGEPGDGRLGLYATGCLIGLVICLLLTYVAARRRGLNKQRTLFWLASILFLGFAVPLSILAIYKRLYRTRCTSCNHARRLDLEQCEHCGTDWVPQASQGIEIRDEANPSLVMA